MIRPTPGALLRRVARVARATLVTVLALSLVSLVPGVPRYGVAYAAVGPAEARAALIDMLTALGDMRDAIDHTRIDVDALAFELAFADAEEIVAFVRDEISFVAYEGILRGGQGALVDGSANAMDQALLTTALLSSAGYDVRLGHGRIEPVDAERLVASMGPAAPADRGMPPLERLEAFAGVLGVDVAGIDGLADTAMEAWSAYQAEVDEVVDWLDARVAGLDGADTDVVAGLVEASLEYVWVEYGFGNDWTQAHPAFPGGEAPATLEVLGYFEDSVPVEFAHRVRMQVFIEQRLGDELTVSAVTEAWERPIVAVYGQALTYANMPDGLLEVDDATDAAALLENTTFFTPFIDGEFAPGAMAFDLDGNTVPPIAAMDQAAGVVRQTGGLFGVAAGVLAGERDPDDFVTLTAQWIEYTLIEPSGHETTHRRTIVDRIGLERRDAGIVEVDPDVPAAAVAEAMTRTHTFMLAPGRYSQAYVVDAQLGATLAARDLLEGILDAEVSLAPETEIPDAFVERSRPLDLLQLFATFDQAPLPPDVLAYRAHPSLVVVERAWDGSSATVDVVQNRQVVVQLRSGALPLAAPQAARIAGVWETFTEGLPIVQDEAQEWNTFVAFERALEQGVELRTLTPADAAQLDQLALPEVSKRAIAADLAAGFVVVTPVAVPEGAPFASWWRSDPSSGETLGRGFDGRGMSYAEYMASLEVSRQLMVGGLILSGTRTLASCGAAGSGVGYACCVYENVLVSGALIGIGAVIGGFFAVSAVAMFVLFDLVIGTGVMMAGMAWDGMPSLCSGISGVCLLPRQV